MLSNIKVLGHRTQSVDCVMPNSGLSRLVAVEADSLNSIEVTWRYEGDTESKIASTFIDTKPSKLLIVSTSSGEQTIINRRNFTSGCSGSYGMSAMVALKNDMSLSPWGDAYTNGAYPQIPQEDNHTVITLTGGTDCFSAIRQDGSIFSWGESHYGGVLPTELTARTDIEDVHYYADGIVLAKNVPHLVLWPGNISLPPDYIANMDNIIDVRINGNDGCVLTSDGKVHAWGNSFISSIPLDIAQLSDIVSIHVNDAACVALRATGELVGWGYEACGGVIPDSVKSLTDIEKIICGNESFCVLRASGAVISWGTATDGGFTPENILARSDISDVIYTSGVNQPPFSMNSAFVAICNDGSLCAWGGLQEVVNVPVVTDVISLSSCLSNCCALKKDGSVISWGQEIDQTPVDELLHNVCAVYAGSKSFIALREDNTIVVWGDPREGGDMTAIPADIQGNVSYYYS
ncbi:hypothetical protein [Citrobacter amalonaticus]|uniref:hypothetical protein n=1 Tax=Citrobacter amalonaticus TaxID=35703 RepID=UPI00300DAD66